MKAKIRRIDRDREQFEKWFDNTFLSTRNPCSTILNIQDRREILKHKKMKEVCLMMLRQNWKTDELRRELALSFFVSMRTALDYVDYAKMILELYTHPSPLSPEKRSKPRERLVEQPEQD